MRSNVTSTIYLLPGHSLQLHGPCELYFQHKFEVFQCYHSIQELYDNNEELNKNVQGVVKFIEKCN